MHRGVCVLNLTLDYSYAVLLSYLSLLSQQCGPFEFVFSPVALHWLMWHFLTCVCCLTSSTALVWHCTGTCGSVSPVFLLLAHPYAAGVGPKHHSTATAAIHTPKLHRLSSRPADSLPHFRGGGDARPSNTDSLPHFREGGDAGRDLSTPPILPVSSRPSSLAASCMSPFWGTQLPTTLDSEATLSSGATSSSEASLRSRSSPVVSSEVLLRCRPPTLSLLRDSKLTDTCLMQPSSLEPSTSWMPCRPGMGSGLLLCGRSPPTSPRHSLSASKFTS
mmetsp:Transcript_27510/g.74420  ORF Transcript_27510/g.74420 Transcript_27510/m.74420 type:complete len:276 (-) Transcript_27510:300-1127(-)